MLIGGLMSPCPGHAALERVEARPGSTSMSGGTGATDFQFGIHVSGTLDQKIEQLERETRLLRFARDNFPPLSEKITYAGTNRPISQCLSDLSAPLGKPIPMDVGTIDFLAKEFVFEKIPLIDALKYLAAFDNAVLDVSGDKLVCQPLRQALSLNELEFKALDLMSKKQFKEVEKILANGLLDVRKITDSDGRTLLHLAAWFDQPHILQRLIELGAKINAPDHAGNTPLYEAVRDGNPNCVEVLLKNGADVNIPCNNNSTALQTAIYYGFDDIANVLVSNGASVDIFTASGLGLVARVKTMLDEGVDYRQLQRDYIEKHSSGGISISSLGDAYHTAPGSYLTIHRVSPLHWAARGGSVEVANLLVTRGESVSELDSNGETPLFWAVANGKATTAEFLIKSGANVNATNFFGATPLLVAARNAQAPDLIKVLVSDGANVNAKDRQGENALHKIAHYGCSEALVSEAQALFSAGADITAKNEEGKTPLDVLLGNSLRNELLVDAFRAYAEKKSNRQ